MDEAAQGAAAPAGKVTAGKVAAGKVTAGKAPAGKATAGKAPAGKAPAGKAPAGKVTAGKVTAGKATAGKATAGKAGAAVATGGDGKAGQGTAGDARAGGPASASEGAVAWGDVERSAPGLAAEVRERFGVRKHCTMATLRRDGSPRISGTEVELSDGQLWIGSMPRAQKALDLRRDPRLAIHSPTVDPPPGDDSGWVGEAKVAGLAVEPEPGQDGHRFRVDLTEVVLTRVDGDELVVTSWHPGRGVQERRRR